MPSISLIVSVVSIVIACVALIRTRRYQQQQIKLLTEQVSIHKEVAALQAEAARAQKAKSVTADVRVALRGGGVRCRVSVRNEGPGAARDLNLNIAGGNDSLLLRGDYDVKLPIRELLPGDEVSLAAGVTHGDPPAYDAELVWTNEDGSHAKRTSRLTLQS